MQVRYKRSTVYKTFDDKDSILRPAKRVKASEKAKMKVDERVGDDEVDEVDVPDLVDMALDLGDLDV